MVGGCALIRAYALIRTNTVSISVNHKPSARAVPFKKARAGEGLSKKICLGGGVKDDLRIWEEGGQIPIEFGGLS